MGRGTTAYIFKVKTDTKIDKVVQSLKSIVTQNKMDFKKEKKGNRGFVSCNDVNDNPFIQLTEPPILLLKYGYYEKKIDPDPSSEEDYKYVYNYFDIWFDINHRIIMVFSSKHIAAAMVKKIMEIAGINLFYIPYSEPFFRWIGNEYKPKPSFRLLVVNGVYIDKLEKLKGDDTTDRLSITTIEDLSKSKSYQLVEDDGDRKYFQGIFKLKDTQFKAKVYKNGKITVDKQVSGVDVDPKSIFTWIYEDVVNIHNDWESLRKV